MRLVRIQLKYWTAGLAKGPVQHPHGTVTARSQVCMWPDEKIAVSVADTDGPFRQEWRLNGTGVFGLHHLRAPIR
jgi:hypothetical protein